MNFTTCTTTEAVFDWIAGAPSAAPTFDENEETRLMMAMILIVTTVTLETLFDYLAYGDTTSVRLVVLHLDIMNLAFS